MRRVIYAVSATGFVAYLIAAPAIASTSSIKCSSGTVTVSSGESGRCTNTGRNITCTNGEGTTVAAGACNSAGVATCSNTSINGSCTISHPSPKPSSTTHGKLSKPVHAVKH